MREINDGGPAFPEEGVERMPIGGNLYRHERVSLPGMSLRDYFAVAALTGMKANPEANADGFDDFARWAYAYADAMLAARKERKS